MNQSHSPAAAVTASHRLWWKRPLDLVVTAVLLPLCLPLIGLLALAVVAESPGPAFFRQERVGLRGTRFRIWKLRSMRDGCLDVRHRALAADWFAGRATEHDRFKTLEDTRITRVGRWLRRLELDELPQLLNVLSGHMSLVGPRPAIPYELPLYRPAYLERLEVPPGMTGLWQVTQRDRLSAAEMMALDLRYVREASLWLDLQVLVRTVTAVLRSALGER